MKFTLFIDKDREEEVCVYAHEESPTTKKLEEIAKGNDTGLRELVGYRNDGIIIFDIDSVYCFYLEDGKLYAMLATDRVHVKKRLYEIEELLPEGFVKINQSAIANISKIERFGVSIGASMTVIYKNGHRDYISRRQLKHVKERIGI